MGKHRHETAHWLWHHRADVPCPLNTPRSQLKKRTKTFKFAFEKLSPLNDFATLITVIGKVASLSPPKQSRLRPKKVR